MRTLVIADDYPWPEDAGVRIRLAMVLRGLRRCGSVELCSVISRFRAGFDPPDPELALDRVARVGFDNRPSAGLGMLAALARPSLPIALPMRDRATVRRALARFMSGRYDLVWYFGPRTWVLGGERVFAPTIIDLFDLEDQKIGARLTADHSPSTPGSFVRRAGSVLVNQEEIRRWRRLYRRTAGRAAVLVVSSEVDAARAEAFGPLPGGVAVVPNGYPPVDRPAGSIDVGTPPTVLFQGLLSYPPNVDAARMLATEIGPELRSLVPDAQIRLVGAHDPGLMVLHDPPRVTVVGRVPDITAELARADVVVVPLRYGSGTRLKIVEAFAHRIPVASTTLGAEGLGAVDGVHLLIGDDPKAMSGACARLLRESALRAALVAEAHALFTAGFRTDVVEDAIARLALETAGRN